MDKYETNKQRLSEIHAKARFMDELITLCIEKGEQAAIERLQAYFRSPSLGPPPGGGEPTSSLSEW